jgi:PAS domain S-box-containing protein
VEDYQKENLEKIAERFFSIAEQTGQLILDGNAITGKIEWSGAIKEFTGYTVEEFSKVDLEGCKYLVHPEDVKRVWSAVERSIQTGEKFEQRYRFRTKDGSYIYVEQTSIFLKDENNRVYRAIGIIKDITEKELDQEKIKTSEESLLRYLHNFRGIGFQLDRNSNLVLLHGAVKEITGYENEDFFSGKIQLDQLVDPEDLRNFFENRKKLSTELNHVVEQEYRVLNRNGNKIWVFESIQVVHSIDKENRLYQGFIQDITERKTAMEALERTEKLRKKEIHHRIKNNLQVISSLLDLECDNLLSAGTPNRETIAKVFQESHNRIISMSLIHEELYNSRDMETINFASYLRKLTDDLFKSYKVGNSDIRLHLDMEDFFFEMDCAIPLGIIVNELVSNSLKHAFPGGRDGEIHIELQRGNNDRTLNNTSVDDYIKDDLHPCKYITLIVEDSGIGFPESIDFKNTNSLGLQLVNTLVDQIDGSIELENVQGTRYKISIPDYQSEVRSKISCENQATESNLAGN